MKRMSILLVAFLMVFMVYNISTAAESSESFEARLAKLEQAMSDVQQTTSDMEIPDWVKNLTKFSGDGRYRFDWTDDDAAADKRHRHTVRGRIAIYGKVNDEMDLIFRVAGEKTMGDSFDDADAYVDLAYFDYHPGTLEKLPFLSVGVDFLDGISPFYDIDGFRGIHILGGKFEDPFNHPGNSSLIFDGQSFEGIAGVVKKSIGEKLDVFSTAGGFWVEERATDADTSLWGIQTGLTWLCLEDCSANLTLGAAYYDFGNIEGHALDDLAGNTDDGTGGYENDFNIVNLFADFGFTAIGLPMSIFADYANNLGASDKDTGYLAGVVVGKTANIGDWRCTYNYSELGADSVVGQFSEGCFGSGTNSMGHKMSVGMKVADGCLLSLTGYIGKRDVGGDDVDYKQAEFDLIVKF